MRIRCNRYAQRCAAPSDMQCSVSRLVERACLRRHRTATASPRLPSLHPLDPVMPASISARYAALVAAGEIERDAGAAGDRRQAGAARAAARRAPPGAQIVVARLAVRRAQAPGRADQGPLHLRRRRPRQDHADGPVLRGVRRSRASAARISTNSWPTCTSACTPIGRRSSPARSPARIRSRWPPPTSPRRPGCSASTNSTSPTSPTP